jgi:hypothetical protein
MADGRLRWDCNRGGAGANCFNRLKRPKWEVFKDCFSRGSTFGDIDAVIDNNGKRFLFVDWKDSAKDSIDSGQHFLFRSLSKLPGVTVLVVSGNAETMEVAAMRLFENGHAGLLQPVDLGTLKTWLGEWWRAGLPAPGTP